MRRHLPPTLTCDEPEPLWKSALALLCLLVLIAVLCLWLVVLT